MGLDGISPNQLRTASELNSGNLNKINSQANPQFIDALAKSQKVNADEKKEQNAKNKNNKAINQEQEDEQNQPDKQDGYEQDIEKIEKFDLSDSKRYILKVDEKTNEILIIEKATQKIVQTFNPEALSNLTKFVNNYTGVLINRKY